MATLYKFNTQPVKGSAFTITLMGLTSRADTDIFQTSVTLAAGDVTLFCDQTALGNITTLPTEIGTSGMLTISLSAAETNYDQIGIKFHDAAGSQWQDTSIWFPTVSAVTVSDFDETTDSVDVATIANDAITAASLNDDAVLEIQSGLSTFDSTADPVSVDDMQTAALAQFFTTNTGLAYSNAVDGSVVKEVLDGVPPSTLGAATLWSYSTRTLTQSAVQVADAVSGATISILRGDTLTASITGLGALTDYVTLDFTIKIDKTAADTTAVIRIRKNLSGLTDGLLTLNGATASTAAWGSITIDDLAAGDITITLSAAATRLLVPSNQQVPYDIQMITASAVQTMATGFANISADVTRAVS